jgi:hypothetical protein
MHLLELFDQYWQHNRGEKVNYILKKNQRDLWATGFCCCVADLRSCAGEKSRFNRFIVRRLAEFGDLRQPALFCT